MNTSREKKELKRRQLDIIKEVMGERSDLEPLEIYIEANKRYKEYCEELLERQLEIEDEKPIDRKKKRIKAYKGVVRR